jgi:alpha-galactosidase
MFAILAEYEIDYIKWDHNRDLIDAGSQPAGRPGVHEQTRAFYRLIDEIKQAHPGLEIESCSSGGARVDLGVLERTDRVWVSDIIDPLERQQMHRWTTQLIPPELMGAHIASAQSHTTGRYHELNFRAGTAIFGHLGVEWDLTQAETRELDELSEWIALFKKHRQMLLTGTVIRADFPDETFAVSGVVSTDLGTAIYAMTSLARSEVALLGRIRLPGLDPGRRYRVTPLMLNFPPSGLVPPPWWGATRIGRDPYEGALPAPTRFAASGSPGIVLSGTALAGVGLSAPVVDPEHTVLYLAEAIN